MDVDPAGECFGKATDAAAQVGEDPQLDLRVVGGEQDATGRRDECSSDPASFLGSNRDILQIRIAGR